MKNACWSLMLAACAAAGCITLPSFKSNDKPDPAPHVSKPARPAPPVTEDQVTEDNVREKFAALRAELDREAEGEPVNAGSGK
jgi:hypothetical protein